MGDSAPLPSPLWAARRIGGFSPGGPLVGLFASQGVPLSGQEIRALQGQLSQAKLSQGIQKSQAEFRASVAVRWFSNAVKMAEWAYHRRGPKARHSFTSTTEKGAKITHRPLKHN